MTATRYGTENHSPAGSSIEERNGLGLLGPIRPRFPNANALSESPVQGFLPPALKRRRRALERRRHVGGGEEEERATHGRRTVSQNCAPLPRPPFFPPCEKPSPAVFFLRREFCASGDRSLPSLPPLSPAGRDGERTPHPPFLPLRTWNGGSKQPSPPPTADRPTDRPSEGGKGDHRTSPFFLPLHAKRGGGGGGTRITWSFLLRRGGRGGWKKKSKEDEGWKQMRAMCLCPPFFLFLLLPRRRRRRRLAIASFSWGGRTRAFGPFKIWLLAGGGSLPRLESRRVVKWRQLISFGLLRETQLVWGSRRGIGRTSYQFAPPKRGRGTFQLAAIVQERRKERRTKTQERFFSRCNKEEIYTQF